MSAHASAAINVRDDTGATISLQQPARRVISLAPHITELLFAAGGGGHVVGVLNYSDYPPAALRLPHVGDNNRIDLEQVLALKPDLVVVWLQGGAARQLEPLRKLGIPIFHSEPEKLNDIPDALERLGQLMGTETEARQSAADIRRRLAALSERYRNRPPVRVFYQVWDQPIYTLNGDTMVSDAIHLCGGENVFARLPIRAPAVNVEAVLAENPEAIVRGGRRDKSVTGLEMWKRYPTLLAAKRDNLFTVDADLMNRAGPRMVTGAAELCEKLELARSRRKESQ
jgi:iron complex transport system substrate-binding protein